MEKYPKEKSVIKHRRNINNNDKELIIIVCKNPYKQLTIKNIGKWI